MPISSASGPLDGTVFSHEPHGCCHQVPARDEALQVLFGFGLAAVCGIERPYENSSEFLHSELRHLVDHAALQSCTT